MSRTVEADRIASGNITKDEMLYLAQRDQLPDELREQLTHDEDLQRELQNALGGRPPLLSDVPNTGDVNTRGVTLAQLKAAGIRLVDEEGNNVLDDGLNPPEQFENARQGQRDPEAAIPREGTATRAPLGEDLEDVDDEDDDDDEDGEEDYEAGWNNDQRRAELSRRGLSIDGDKPTLIARLVEDDVAKKLEGGSSTEPPPA